MKKAIAIGCLLVMQFGIGTIEATDRPTEWNALVDEYLDKVYFPQNPTAATAAGIHRYDGQIEEYSREAANEEIRTLHEYEMRVLQFPADGLKAVDAADRQILLGEIRSELLTLEAIRPLEKNPDIYSSGITNSVYVLMNRKFAPAEDRLRSVIQRERKMPEILKEARQNLSDTPKVYTEIAIEQLPGIIGFFQKDVPTAFTEVTNAELRKEFEKSNGQVIDTLKEYQTWLKTDLLPHSKGDFRIGAETFSKKLHYEDMVDTPLDQLLAIGIADLRKNQAELLKVAKEIDPKKKPTEVMKELGTMHPAPDQLLETFRGTFDGLIAFIQEKKIITIPAGAKPIVQETPPFERATTTASMDTPGPFEKVAKESYFNVTLPGAEDSAGMVASLMAAFNIGTIVSTSTHETYPGHYMQYLWTPQAPTKLRKTFYANTNSEGWAHYCEQMMLEEGYGQPGVGAKDARESKYIHLGQLQDALLRDARFVVGIQMHTGKMSFGQAKDFFVKEGYQSVKVAEIEAKRGTADPTYLYYTLGKLQILKLREDYKKKMGAEFTLLKFHDDFMSQGFPPIAVVRQAMLGDNSPVL
ncbi:MAG TPA: DUF885 domain-containing protein [Candidatus Acidoferrum sp.]|jgi:uncharacterized protein (DUF885 family)